MANLAVFGLGYVGSVTAACFAAQGHNVVAVETNSCKVTMLRQGISPVSEPGLSELIRNDTAAGMLKIAEDTNDAVAQSSMGFITVGTPSKRNGDVDLGALEHVCHQLGGALRKHVHPYTVVLRSTVLPGTTSGLVVPALIKASGRTLGKDLWVVFNPEFLREGTAVHDFYNPPYIILGQVQTDAAPSLRDLWNALSINAPIFEIRAEEAEMLKYTCNAFHALKIVFANEIGAICQQLGVDAQAVMSIFVKDRKLNISGRYLKPGFAYGGSCLPKDLQALTFLARRLDVSVPVIHNICSSNGLHLSRAVAAVLETGVRRVSVIGLAFKAGTDDVRNSPAVSLCEQLLGKGISVSIFDRHIVPEYLLGRNKDFLDATLPHIASLFKRSIHECIASGDIVVICNHDPELTEALTNSHVRAVIDLTSNRPCLQATETVVAA
jgi:GDP-mannose 6-dehydrogenase